MQVFTQWTDSDVWSQLATTPECLFKIGDRQSVKKWRNGDRRAICDTTRGLDAGHGVNRHRGVSDGSDGARPLWRSHSARTEMFFADGSKCNSKRCIRSEHCIAISDNLKAKHKWECGMWWSTKERHTHCQALCKLLQHNCSPCEECNTHVVLMVRIRHHKVKEVHMQRDG